MRASAGANDEPAPPAPAPRPINGGAKTARTNSQSFLREEAAIHRGIEIPHAELIIRKGYHPQVDSYLASSRRTSAQTGLDGYLKGRGIHAVYAVGRAADFCIAWTAIETPSDRIGASGPTPGITLGRENCGSSD
jgi:nicotinamidase-related amidase